MIQFRVNRLLFLIALAAAGCEAEDERSAIPTPDLKQAYDEVRTLLLERQQAVNGDRRSASAWGRYAMALDAHEYTSEAIECYRIAVDLDADNLRWSYLLARKVRERDPEQAEDLLRRTCSAKNANLAMLLVLADLQSELGMVQEAERTVKKAGSISPLHPAVVFRSAQLCFERRDFETAAKLLQAIEDRYVETARLKNRISAFRQADGEDDAETVADDVRLSVDSTVNDRFLNEVRQCRCDPFWNGRLAAEKAANGDQFALMVLERLVKKYPDLTDNRLQLATVIQSQGDLNRASQVLLRGLELAPGDTRLMTGLATLAMLGENWTSAERYLVRVVELSPGHQAAWADLAFVLEQLARDEEAVNAYNTALSLNPEDKELQKRLTAVIARSRKK